MRYALAAVYGDGTDVEQPWTTTTGPYRPATFGYGSFRCLLPPGSSYSLVELGADADLVAINGLADVRLLPDWPLDEPLTANRANQINNAAARFGIAANAQAGMTLRQVLDVYVASLDGVGWGIR